MRITPTREALHDHARKMKKNNKEEEEKDNKEEEEKDNKEEEEEEDLKKEVDRLNSEVSRLRQRLADAGLSCDDD